ncbi:hypothetical protein CONPUDRAFT_47026 [Coniophora puteana RWD-64-598 SS2]|uniref:JmjC domain-containing protein n=1 Tax=Coniophora puteana (strain RWD-64-598) TaxID=741705 RepID=A0A5M3N2B8_CONPW|nr:uncharacterized protein CONPUDRAFT_47026 [Coniophora puteana RWD-64-598 SS2]EIW85075.1 hypothetical protein CONPUDRAFT_47026 [Coniophora puteana RWD-64-598 SS2]
MESWRSKLQARPISWGALPSTYPSAARVAASASQSQSEQRAPSSTPADLSLKRSVDCAVSDKCAFDDLVPNVQLDPTATRTTRDWTLDKLLEMSTNFRRIRRIHARCADLKEITEKHESEGVPLIIEGYQTHPHWPSDVFSPEGFIENGNPVVNVRNVHNRADGYLRKAELIQKLRNTPRFTVADGNHERFYGKDIECPDVWAAQLGQHDFIPDHLLFKNKDDMLGNLPDSGQVQTLMCYLGVGDTFTPFHKDPCGSIGQNIMVYTESGGSSFWFMTEGSHALELAQYFQELGYVLDWETYVATIEELKNAPFPVYIAEQTLGDMIIVPPKVGHQVVNYGGISIKVAWSRMSISSLKISLYEELPLYRRVCRAETYKVKAIIHYALRQYSVLLQECTRFIKWEGRNQLTQTSSRSPRQREQVTLAKILQDLLLLYQDIIIEEQCPGNSDLPYVTEGTSPYKYDILCDYCGGDIFQSFFECFACVDVLSTSSATSEQGSGICICPSCYIEGRTCFCGGMSPVQCRPFDELLRSYNNAADVLAESGLERSSTPLRLFPHQRY